MISRLWSESHAFMPIDPLPFSKAIRFQEVATFASVDARRTYAFLHSCQVLDQLQGFCDKCPFALVCYRLDLTQNKIGLSAVL